MCQRLLAHAVAPDEGHEDAGRRATAAEFIVRYPDPADGLARIASTIEMIEALAIDPMQVEASCRVIAADLAALDADYTADLCERAAAGTQLALHQDGRTIHNRLEAYKYGIRLAVLNETIRKLAK